MHANTHQHIHTISKLRFLTIAAAFAVLFAACGGATESIPDAGQDAQDTPTDAEATDDHGMDDLSPGDMGGEDMSDDMSDDMDEDMEMSGTYGEPADPSEADRTIEVNVDNDLRFEPAEFEAAVGEVITFRITNTGDVEHEFVLGDEEAQQQMAETMAEDGDHGHSGDMGNAVTIHAGETGELTWRFSEAGTVLIGCHVPGHWESGMKGEVRVS